MIPSVSSGGTGMNSAGGRMDNCLGDFAFLLDSTKEGSAGLLLLDVDRSLLRGSLGLDGLSDFVDGAVALTGVGLAATGLLLTVGLLPAASLWIGLTGLLLASFVFPAGFDTSSVDLFWVAALLFVDIPLVATLALL